MNITNNYQLNSPNFKQITITPNGEKALKRIYYRFAQPKDMEIANRKYPTTKYWDMVIDGAKEYDKHLQKYFFTPVFKYISKKTGEIFENLSINPPTNLYPGEFYMCSSKKHKCLPSKVLLFSSNEYVTNAANVKELAFDIKSYDEATKFWRQYYNSSSNAVYVYTALEEMSGKYESSLNKGIDKLLKNHPEYDEEVKRNLHRNGYVWISDGGVDQWT